MYQPDKTIRLAYSMAFAARVTTICVTVDSSSNENSDSSVQTNKANENQLTLDIYDATITIDITKYLDIQISSTTSTTELQVEVLCLHGQIHLYRRPILNIKSESSPGLVKILVAPEGTEDHHE